MDKPSHIILRAAMSKKWYYRKPEKVGRVWVYLDAFGTPFYYAKFTDYEHAKAALKFYCDNMGIKIPNSCK